MEKLIFLLTFLKIKLLGFLPRPALLLYQSWLKKRIASSAARRFDYYKGMQDFNQIPVMNKKTYTENFSLLNTHHFQRDRLIQLADEAELSGKFSEPLEGCSVGLSTGTSGLRGIYIASKRERIKWIAALLAKASFIPFKKHRLALFLRSNNQLYETTENTGFIEFKYFDLRKPTAELMADFAQFNPTVLVAPPAILKMIAQYVEQNQISMQDVTVISAADVLEKQDKRILEGVFKTRVNQIYQATEGFLGISCSQGNIHLNEEWIIFEKDQIDSKNFCPIITDTMRETQAFIRFRLDDVLEPLDSCPCGKGTQALSAIGGRFDDIIKGFSEPVFPDYIRARIANKLMSYNEFMFEQVETKKFVLHTKEGLQSQEQEGITTELKKYFQDYFKENIQIDFAADLVMAPSGKRKRVKALELGK